MMYENKQKIKSFLNTDDDDFDVKDDNDTNEDYKKE